MRLGLSARYALALVSLTVSIVVLLSGALLFQFRATEHEMQRSSQAVTRSALISQLEKRGRGMATYLADNLANPLYRLDMDLIRDLVRAAALQKGVNYAVVFDASLKVLHDGTETLENYGLPLGDEVTRRAVRTGEVSAELATGTLNVAAPILIGSQLIGGVKVSLSLTDMRRDVADLEATLAHVSSQGTRNYVIAAIIVSTGLIVLSLLLSVWVARGLTRPIQILSDLTRRIGKGQYEIEVPFDRADEIGDLAASLRRMAADLRQTTVSKDYVDNILGSMLDPLLVFGLDGSLASANAAACRVFCRDLAGLVGLRVDDILDTGAFRGGRFEPDLMDRSDSRVSEEGALIRPTGARVPALIAWSVMRDPEGRADQVICLARDISDRKRAEEEKRSSEERFRSLVGNLPSAVSLKDVDGRFLLVNRRFEDWYDAPPDKACGRTSHDLFPERLAEIFAAQDAFVLRTGRASEREVEIPFADGQLHSVIVTNFPVPAGDGTIIGVGTINTDVTGQRRAEERLSQAQKMEAMGQLTGGIAHDFNNLLGVIIGNAEILGDRLGNDDAQAQAVMRAAVRAEELTRRLLAFSRRQPLRPQAVDLAAMVRDMRDLLARTLGETVEIIIPSCPGLWQAKADPGQLESAILNLAINARDAMPNGGILVIETRNTVIGRGDTAARSEVKPGDYVMLSVRDTGCGMRPDVLEHAFEPFFTTKDVGKGTGLGLSMIYGFAKQSGGRVTIESTPDEGTVVKLCLPRAEDVWSRSAGDPEAEEPTGQGEIVLVVEDAADVRALAVALLDGLGYRVVEAADGRSGLAIVADPAIRIDMVLSDVVLPGGMSGPDFVAGARAQRPGLKVLFMSGYAEAKSLSREALPAGTALLKKPFRKYDLAVQVRAVLDGEPSEPTRATA